MVIRQIRQDVFLQEDVMAFASHTHRLGVLCVVLTIVASGEKLQFVLRVFFVSIQVKFTVKCVAILQQ